MAKVSNLYYLASDYGPEEEELFRNFRIRLDDSRMYFLQTIKPRLDRSYKLYIAYTGDRARDIKSWQSNIFVPYIQAVVETLMPRVLDARPDFTVKGRSEDDQLKAEKQQKLMDYLWEISEMDSKVEDLARSAMIYGQGYLQAYWKKDVRKQKFLKTTDLLKKKYKYVEEERTFYDAPSCDWVDNYSLWYDWHNTERASKQWWIKRLVLSREEIIRRYPGADPKRLEMAFNSGGGNLEDYASVRNQVKTVNFSISKGDTRYSTVGAQDKYNHTNQNIIQMFETFEYYLPFHDQYAVMIGGGNVPVLREGFMPIPYDFKEAPFIPVPYLKIPGEFEGYGIPMILENPQIMLNMIKNQRLDNATLSIHKMWIVNPLANIDKNELVTRPFGIIYSIDPQGVREVQFGDIKQSAYKEEDLLKGDMRYSSGVDDFSMGSGGQSSSATEVRHLRESTLERVRLFVNHLGEGFGLLMRFWIDMERQFFTKSMTIRILGADGQLEFPIIEKDDLEGKFDYVASVLPSIAGMQDVKKKQDMDLFQLLINLPFIDPRKLTSKVLEDWDWNLDAIAQPQGGPAGGAPGGMPPGGPSEQGDMGIPGVPAGAPAQGGMPPLPAPGGGVPTDFSHIQLPFAGKHIPPHILNGALSMLKGSNPSSSPSFAAQNPFGQASGPINLLNAPGTPPVAAGIPNPTSSPQRVIPQTTNHRGHNKGGKVNTNLSSKPSSPEGHLMQQAGNIQR